MLTKRLARNPVPFSPLGSPWGKPLFAGYLYRVETIGFDYALAVFTKEKP
jgi:hypothetical protein